MPVRVVLVDDHRILRDGLRLILRGAPDCVVAGEAGDGRAALECVRRERPDLVLMDLQLPDETGIVCSQHILAEFPETRILVLSASPDLSLVREALRLGARGYVMKDEAAEELVRAIRTVMQGQVHLSPAAATALAGDLQAAAAAPPSAPSPRLSERETAVLRHIVAGLRNKEIAAELGVGVKSVETYRARVMAKLGCPTTAELVRYAIRTGLVAP